MYLSNEEVKSIGVNKEELWRVVRLEVTRNDWISWIHEREWRSKGSFKLPVKSKFGNFRVGVIVKTYREAIKMQRMIDKYPDKFKSDISVILPLDIICQGLYI